MKNHTPSNPDELRRQAEEKARNMAPASLSVQTPEEIQQTLHELQVQQIELEMQNEELRRAQAEIEAGRERYYDLYDLAPVAYCTLSEKGLILEANLTAATLLGTPRGALVKQPISRFILKDDQDSYDLHHKKLFEAGKPQEFELRLVKPDGTLIWAHVTATTAQAEDGTPVCRCVLSDITERKQAEEGLRESENLLSRSQGIAHIGSWKLDLTTNRLTWTDEVYRIFGCKPQEFAPSYEAFLDFVHPEDRDAVDEAYSRSVREQSDGYDIEHRIVRRNSDEVRYVYERCVHERDASGAVIQSAGMVQDITTRNQAETYHEMGREILEILNEPGDLQESIPRVLDALKTRTGFDAVGLRLQEGEDFPYFAEDGFPADFLQTENTLVERGRDGGVCRDKDGNICLECTCGLVLSGKTEPADPSSTQGGSYWTNDSFPLLDLPSDQDPRLHPRNNCIHQGYASVALIPVRTKKRIVGLIQLNDKRKGRFTLETIEILEGIAAHIGSALMRKRAEEEGEKLQAQLIQAQKMESVGRLAGGVAHDFNNMLMGIMGYADMCRDEIGKDHPIRDYLDEIKRGAHRSANLTRQLLAFARKQTIAPKVLDLNEVVTGMLKMLRRLIGEDIDLSWEPGAGLWSVKLDSGQVDQILANLCVNARDAIGGVGKVTIETQNVSIDADYCAEHAEAVIGPHVMLAISDDGYGMERETLTQVFEPFYTTKGVGEGTGLGLATVYGIVKQNGGFVNVYSELGKGTTFCIYLPRFAGEHSGREEAQTTEERSGGRETVMLVEDEKSVLVTTARFLEQLGYTVLTAETPSAALRLAAEHEGAIELLITDVVLPGMSGRDLAAELIEEHPRLKCLYISGYTANVIAHRGILEEGVHFLSKPFTRDNIARKVFEILKGTQTRGKE